MALTEEQRRIALSQGQALTGGELPTLKATDTGFEKISSSSLTPVPSADFQTPEDTPIFPVSGLGGDFTPPAQLTGTEKQAQGQSDLIQRLREQTLGESAFRAEQEDVQGISELQKTQTDLSSRLKALQNEALQIPLQLQQEATGRGITEGGLRPLQTARLRENAIQALGVNSLLEASRGNLTTALDMVDRAVAQKFDPIREEIAVRTANLQTILDSPQFSLEQKNRAQRQLEIQQARQAETEREEEEQRQIQALAVQVAATGKADGLILDAIRKSKDLVSAMQISAGILEQPEVGADFTLGKDQIRFDAEGNVIARGAPSTGTGVEGSSSSVEGWANLLSTGQASISNVPTGMRDAVVKHLNTNNIDIRKILSPTQIQELTQTEAAVASLKDLREVINDNLQFVGPIAGFARFNPWSDARKAQADIDRVRQTVGKALEGGVLRKEDEEKYKKILATLADTPDTALYKIDSLVSTLERDLQNWKETQTASGRFVEAPSETTLTSEQARSKYNY